MVSFPGKVESLLCDSALGFRQYRFRLAPRRSIKSAPGAAQCRRVVFLALAFEFLLGLLEACDTRRNFGSIAREPFFPFRHCPILFLILIRARVHSPARMGRNWESLLRNCVRAVE